MDLNHRTSSANESDDGDDSMSCSSVELGPHDAHINSTAEKCGLTGVNVRNIIHHIVRNESVLQTLLSDEVPGEFDVRLTRSRAKKLNQEEVEDKVVYNKFLEEEFSEDDISEYQPSSDDHSSDAESEKELEKMQKKLRALQPQIDKRAEEKAKESSSEYSSSESESESDEYDETKVDEQTIEEEPENDAQDDDLAIDEEPAEDEETIASRTRLKCPLQDEDLLKVLDPLPDYDENLYNAVVDDADWQQWLAQLFQDDSILGSTAFTEDDSELDPDFDFLAHLESLEEVEDEVTCNKATEIPRKEQTELVQETRSYLQMNKSIQPDIVLHKRYVPDWTAIREILRQQFQMHLQLLLQSYFLAKANATHANLAILSKSLIEETYYLFTEESSFKLPDLQIQNLRAAYDLLEHDVTSKTRTLPKISRHLMMHSTVFTYPELLPHCAFQDLTSIPPRNIFCDAEDCIIALAAAACEELSDINGREIILSRLCEFVHDQLLPNKTAKSIFYRYRYLLCVKSPPNALKFYRRKGYLPEMPQAATYIPLGKERAPIDMQLKELPDWMKILKRNILKPPSGNLSPAKPRSTNCSPAKRASDKIVRHAKRRLIENQSYVPVEDISIANEILAQCEVIASGEVPKFETRIENNVEIQDSKTKNNPVVEDDPDWVPTEEDEEPDVLKTAAIQGFADSSRRNSLTKPPFSSKKAQQSVSNYISSSFLWVANESPDVAARHRYLVENYFKRVCDRFGVDKYNEFVHVVKMIESVGFSTPDTSAYIHSLLNSEPDLLRDFCYICTPDIAYTLGIHDEYVSYLKAKSFLRRVEACMKGQPRLYERFICQLAGSGSLNEKTIFERTSPLLNNQLLLDEFTLFFKSMPVPESFLCDFEEIFMGVDDDDDPHVDEGIAWFEEIVMPAETDNEKFKASFCSKVSRSKRKSLEEQRRKFVAAEMLKKRSIWLKQRAYMKGFNQREALKKDLSEKIMRKSNMAALKSIRCQKINAVIQHEFPNSANNNEPLVECQSTSPQDPPHDDVDLTSPLNTSLNFTIDKEIIPSSKNSGWSSSSNFTMTSSSIPHGNTVLSVSSISSTKLLYDSNELMSVDEALEVPPLSSSSSKQGVGTSSSSSSSEGPMSPEIPSNPYLPQQSNQPTWLREDDALILEHIQGAISKEELISLLQSKHNLESIHSRIQLVTNLALLQSSESSSSSDD